MINSKFIPILRNFKTIETSNKGYTLYSDNVNPIEISSLGKKLLDLTNGDRSIYEIFRQIDMSSGQYLINDFVIFYKKLSENNILKNHQSIKEKGVREKIFFIELFSFKSDKWIKRISEIFSNKFVLIKNYMEIFIVFFGTTLLFSSSLEFNLNTFSFETFQKKSFALLFIVFFIIQTILHEVSHAISCRHYRQEVRKIGVALYFFYPVFFVNTSNMWNESNKFKRIMVSLAGPLSDFALISFLYILFCFGLLSFIEHQVIIFLLIFSVVKAVMNLNPFIKLDGYYVLMDYLEIPNLRKKSFTYLKSLFKKGKNEELRLKTKFLFFIFGILSSLITLFLLVRPFLWIMR